MAQSISQSSILIFF